MLHLKNIDLYTPEDPWLGEVLYFQDDQGRDWYKMQKEFREDTIKVFYDPGAGGQISTVTFNPDQFTPEGLCVVEMDPDSIPSHVSIDPEKGWVYQDGIVSRLLVQYDVEARNLRNAFLKATDPLMVFDFTINDEMISEEQRREAAGTRIAFKTWPKTPGWPMVPLPSVPEWMMEQAVKNGFVNKAWPE